MKGQNANRGNNQKNGHRRSNSRYNNSNYNNNNPTSPSGNNFVPNEDGNDRLLFLVTKSIGKKVTVTITTGARYQGLLLSADLSSQGSSALSVILLHPTLITKSLINEKSNIDNENEVPEKLIIESKDLIDLEVSDIDLNESSKPKAQPQPQVQPPAQSVSPQFKTDTDISGGRAIRERELQRWVPDENEPHNPILSLDEDTFGSSKGQWDQFKVNEDKFGVQASYDEHLYTTRIDTSAPDYKERVARADRLAKEIEGQISTDRHILEERGHQVDDSGIDEEDKYSGVDRRGDELMAALRNASITNDSSSSVASRTPGSYVPPRQRAAEYHNDPAIISSSAANKPKNASVVSPTGTPEPGPIQAPSVPAVPVPAPVSPTDDSKPAPVVKGPPAKPDSVPAKPQVPAQHNESFRLNAQSEINSLREFSANFKIPHKLPSDLLPILSKDKLKQDEILKKQLEQQRQKLKKEQLAQQQAQQAQQAQQQGQTPKKKVDATKPAAFKLNPKAVAFTPSNKHVPLSPNPPKAAFHRSPNNPSPRMNNSRPYSGAGSNGSSSGSSRRHHQISPAEFFGGADRIPTKEGQEQKRQQFKYAFSLFVTARKVHEASGLKSPVVYERTFKTPPTWDSTFDDTHDKLFPSINSLGKGPGMMVPSSQFIQSPLMSAPNVPAGYPTPNGSKFPLSPQQQQQAAVQAAMAAHFQQQQQQFHAAMMYQQQFQGGVPPGQPPFPGYPGGDPGFLPPPGGFMPPPGGFVPGGSPVNGNIMMGGGNPYGGGNHHNYNHHHGGRRFNNHGQGSSKRGGHN